MNQLVCKGLDFNDFLFFQVLVVSIPIHHRIVRIRPRYCSKTTFQELVATGDAMSKSAKTGIDTTACPFKLGHILSSSHLFAFVLNNFPKPYDLIQVFLGRTFLLIQAFCFILLVRTNRLKSAIQLLHLNIFDKYFTLVWRVMQCRPIPYVLSSAWSFCSLLPTQSFLEPMTTV